MILPIYLASGRETAARPVTSNDVVVAIRRTGHADARALTSFDDAVEAIVAAAKPGDIVLTMGAGDVTLLADRLVQALGGRRDA